MLKISDETKKTLCSVIGNWVIPLGSLFLSTYFGQINFNNAINDAVKNATKGNNGQHHISNKGAH